MLKCKQNDVDYRKYNLLNFGRYRIRRLSIELFGQQKTKDIGYSQYEQARKHKINNTKK